MEKKLGTFKIVVLGEARVGKTSLTLRFCKGNFDDKQISTIDASCLSQTIQVGGGGKVQVNIWDTAGQERYHALNKVYYQGAEGALIVYDITDLESWAKVNIWVKELQKFLPPETPILITGNKCDIPNRQIPLDEAERYALNVGSQHFSSSAKTGHGVNEIFRILAERIIEYKKTKQSQQPVMKKNQRIGIPLASFEPDDNLGGKPPMGGSGRGQGVRLTQVNFENRESNNNSEKQQQKKKKGCC